MADFTATKIDDMEGLYGGGFKKARSELGVTSFGMQIIDMPANSDRYPDHDHSQDGQEEVYVILSGEATMTVGGETVELDPSVMVRVGAETKRKVATGDSQVRMLVLGGVPGKAFEAYEFTDVGAPDPTAG